MNPTEPTIIYNTKMQESKFKDIEDDFLKFLISREINTDIIKSLQHDKMDYKAIAHSSVELLTPYFPKLGDRIEIIEFCKQKLKMNDPKKNMLLENIKKTMANNKRKTQKKYYISSDDESKNTLPQITSYLPRQNPKSTRQILVGWLSSINGNRHVQIKSNNGGGTMKLSAPKDADKQFVIQEAKDFFFDKGTSPLGEINKFNFDLWDSSRRPILLGTTAEEMYLRSRQTRLRVYLISTEKTSTATWDRCRNNNNEDFINVNSSNINISHSTDSHELEVENHLVFNYEQLVKEVVIEDSNNFNDNSLLHVTDLSENNSSSIRDVNTLSRSLDHSFSIFETGPSHDSHEDLSQSIPSSFCSEEKIILHRGNIFNELLTEFCKRDKDCATCQIEIVHSNGQKEVGFDAGGIWRDCLSEFWSTFYERYTIGADFKIPFLQHHMNAEKWQAVAKIIYRGWKDERYFPIKLNPIFMEYCILGKENSDIIQCFLKFLSLNERDTLSSALEHFPQNENDDLLEVMENLECHVIVTSENLEKTITDIAYKELIQKPKYVIDCWQSVLHDLLPSFQLQKLYENCIPSTKNIISALTTEGSLDSGSLEVYRYLKKYIRECDEKRRTSFLRYCTGADVLIGKQISVTFNDRDGFDRAPIAHTCGCVLELPKTFLNFPEFRSEFNSILDSNIWVFDIV